MNEEEEHLGRVHLVPSPHEVPSPGKCPVRKSKLSLQEKLLLQRGCGQRPSNGRIRVDWTVSASTPPCLASPELVEQITRPVSRFCLWPCLHGTVAKD